MKWLDTNTTDDSSASATAFWQRHRADLHNGQFWADRVAKYRDQPIERLQLSIQNLPLPAAFRESAIAIRALIRSRMKERQDYVDELALLYWLSAVESFGVPHSAHLRQPGFNVLQSVPGHVIKSLPFTYRELGYKHLSMLNKTDTKWCVTCWGEPLVHTTLNALHAGVWHKYEIEEGLRQERERRELWSR